MSKITIAEESGMSYDDFALIQQAARIEGVTTDEFVAAVAIAAAEDIVGQDIEDMFAEEY